MTERLRKILRGASITPKTADEAAVTTAIENAGGGGSGDGGNVLRIPFTLTVEQETGAITGTTEAVIADAAAALDAGKILIADATLDAGAFGEQHLCAVMSGTVGDSSAFKACVSSLSDSGATLELYGIAWDATGVTVHGGSIAVST